MLYYDDLTYNINTGKFLSNTRKYYRKHFDEPKYNFWDIRLYRRDNNELYSNTSDLIY